MKLQLVGLPRGYQPELRPDSTPGMIQIWALGTARVIAAVYCGYLMARKHLWWAEDMVFPLGSCVRNVQEVPEIGTITPLLANGSLL
jgi:hypothetical protein